MRLIIISLIIGLVIGVVSGAFATLGVCLLAPFVIVGSVVAFILSIFVPPLREWGLAFVFFSVGLLMGIIINGLVAGVIV